MNGNIQREMRQLERRSSSGVVSVFQELHMDEQSCVDDNWRELEMRAYLLPNLGMKRG